MLGLSGLRNNSWARTGLSAALKDSINPDFYVEIKVKRYAPFRVSYMKDVDWSTVQRFEFSPVSGKLQRAPMTGKFW